MNWDDPDRDSRGGKVGCMVVAVPAAALVAVLLVGCTTPPLPPPASTALPQADQPVTLDPGDFTADITHPYWPMVPGTRWTYRAVSDEGTETAVVIATGATRTINGVEARVVRDTVSEDGVVTEDTFDWFAQDRAGNVWYLGEDTIVFEPGEPPSREGSWTAGVDGAQPGIALPADLTPGLAYRQEWYEGHAEDNGMILSTSEMVETPTGFYRGALVTRDTSTIEPKVSEHKWYAQGVGPVATYAVSGEINREVLVELDHVGPSAGTQPLGKRP